MKEKTEGNIAIRASAEFGYLVKLLNILKCSKPQKYKRILFDAARLMLDVFFFFGEFDLMLQVVASLAALDCQGTILASFPVQDATNEVELSMAPGDAVQPDGKLTEKQDRTTSEDADLGQDIASAVAEFLTFDEGESPEDEATTRFEGAVWEIQAGTSDKSEEAEVRGVLSMINLSKCS